MNAQRKENGINDIWIQEIVNQHPGGEHTIYLVWNATVKGQWESFISYEEAINFIYKVTGDNQYCPY